MESDFHFPQHINYVTVLDLLVGGTIDHVWFGGVNFVGVVLIMRLSETALKHEAVLVTYTLSIAVKLTVLIHVVNLIRFGGHLSDETIVGVTVFILPMLETLP